MALKKCSYKECKDGGRVSKKEYRRGTINTLDGRTYVISGEKFFHQYCWIYENQWTIFGKEGYRLI